MNVKKLVTLLLAAVLVLSLAACGAAGGDKKDGEPKNAEEAAAMYKELMEQENAILGKNTELWEKVFMAADKGMTMQEDGKNYGEFLLDTIEGSKDQFTEDELKLLKEAAEKIREIENKLTMIEKKYPEAAQQSKDGAMSVPAGSDMTTPPTCPRLRTARGNPGICGRPSPPRQSTANSAIRTTSAPTWTPPTG